MDTREIIGLIEESMNTLCRDFINKVVLSTLSADVLPISLILATDELEQYLLTSTHYLMANMPSPTSLSSYPFNPEPR